MEKKEKESLYLPLSVNVSLPLPLLRAYTLDAAVDTAQPLASSSGGAACERAPFAATVLPAVLVPWRCIGFAFPKVADSKRAVLLAPTTSLSTGFAVFEGAHLAAATAVLAAQSL